LRFIDACSLGGLDRLRFGVIDTDTPEEDFPLDVVLEKLESASDSGPSCNSSVSSRTLTLLVVTGFMYECVIPDFKKNDVVSTERDSLTIITTGAVDFIVLSLVAKSSMTGL
jgi:hypothetical protein